MEYGSNTCYVILILHVINKEDNLKICQKFFKAPFMDIVNAHPDWLVIDIGAQIGQFSLFAAKLGRDVVAIEPFFDNIIRFHKAVVNEGLEQRIRLITNAISDERGQVRLLQKIEDNIGGQYLIRTNETANQRAFSRSDRLWNKYLVETIWLDDILDYLPKKANNQPYKYVS